MGLSLIIGLICGIICAAIASSKGRNPVGWFFVGFLTGIIGLIIILCMSDLKAQRAKEQANARERRLLREQLRQERIKNETFRQHTSARLDSHDRTLGLDTRSLGAALPAEDPALALEAMRRDATEPEEPSAPLTPVPAPPAQPAQAQQATGASKPAVWYYELEGAQCGPVSGRELRRLVRAGTITLSTLVWTEKLTDWIPARRIPALLDEASR